MLVDAETGMPTWWPTLFVTTQLRITGKSVSTMETALRAIQILFSFVEGKGIKLEERFLTRWFLETHGIDDLCDFAQWRTDGTGAVSTEHHHSRLSYIASFLQWLATEVLGNRGTVEDANAIAAMAKKVKSRRPRSRQTYQHKNRGISEEALARLMEIIEPDHPDSPFEDKRAAVRNKIAILILEETGMRRGELLGLLPTAIFCFAGLVCVVGRRNDGVERKARVGAAGSVASGVGERSGTRFGLKRDAEVAVRTHRSHRGYRRAKIRGGGNQGVAGSRRWRTACSGHRA